MLSYIQLMLLTVAIVFLFFNPKKRAFMKDINNFFTIDNLDKLQSDYISLKTKYGLNKIQKYYRKCKLPKTEQGMANLLFYPQILDAEARLIIQKIAILNNFRDYVFLATVCGLQDEKFDDVNNYSFFVKAMGGYLEMIRSDNLKSWFPQIIVNRIAVTLFIFPQIEAFYTISEVIIPLLENPEFESCHHNLLLVLAKHESPLFFSDKLEKVASPKLTKEIQEMREIFNLKDDELNEEQDLKKMIHYACIPNLNGVYLGRPF